MGVFGLQVGIVDCQDSKHSELCYETHKLPQTPHRPAGAKHHADLGDILYNVNEVEPHIVMMILEKTLRLALADRKAQQPNSVMLGKPSEFEGDEEEEDQDQKTNAQGRGFGGFQLFGADELMRSGPDGEQAAPKPWNGFGQGNVNHRLV